MNADFTLDARYVVVNNPIIKQSALFYRIWTRDLFASFKEPAKVKMQYYRPLTLLSLALDYQIWKLNPFGYRLTNIIIHSFNSLLVYILLLQLFKRQRLAFFSAFFFCILPIHEWVVNYVVGRGDLCQTLFLLLSLIAFSHAIRSIQKDGYLLSLLFFVLALLCREIAIIGSLLVFLIGRCITHDIKKSWTYTAPFIILSLLYLALRSFAFPILTQEGAAALSANLSFGIIGEWIFVCVVYLFRFLFPWSAQTILFAGFRDELMKLAVFFVLVVGWIIYEARRSEKERKSLLVFGGLWILINFLPFFIIMSQFLHIGPILSEHYLYLSSIGFCLILSTVLMGAERKIKNILIMLLAIYYSGLVVYNNAFWTTEKDLLRHIKEHEGNYSGVVTFQYLMRFETDEKKIEEALQETDDSHRKSRWLNRLGDIHAGRKNYRQAIDYYNESVKVFPDNARAYGNLGIVYYNLGQRQRAVGYLARSLRINPESDQALLNLGMIFYKEKRWPQAIALLEKAAFYNPQNMNNWLYLGIAQYINGQTELAFPSLMKAAAITNDDSLMYRFIAAELYNHDRKTHALYVLKNALNQSGYNTETAILLGKIYYNTGDKQNAIAAWQKVLEFDPDNKEARECLLREVSKKKEIPVQIP